MRKTVHGGRDDFEAPIGLRLKDDYAVLGPSRVSSALDAFLKRARDTLRRFEEHASVALRRADEWIAAREQPRYRWPR